MLNYYQQFIDYLTYEKQHSKLTIKAYEDDLHEFEKFLVATKVQEKDVDSMTAHNYVVALIRKGNSRRSIARKISSLRGFYKFQVKNEFRDDNPFLGIETQKYEKALPSFLPVEQIIELLNVNINENSSINERNQAIINLLYSSGMRVSELVNLKLSDLDVKEQTIRILGKGNKERIGLINEYSLGRVIHYIENGRLDLKSKNPDKCDYIILNNRGGKITSRGVELIVKQMGYALKQPKDIYPHMLRHSLATHMMDNGMDLRSVQELLGHKSLSATQVYTHVSSAHLHEVYDATHPRAHKK
ncbi:MAG: tyrosine-type recombinase/integrase [Bacilli bacterium]|nr:tyrosine-type recombinase/integrase [Bacilli bacterium]MDD3422288.1 tyrosine-type recombinase/integrase [Bacilli bacterium]